MWILGADENASADSISARLGIAIRSGLAPIETRPGFISGDERQSSSFFYPCFNTLGALVMRWRHAENNMTAGMRTRNVSRKIQYPLVWPGFLVSIGLALLVFASLLSPEGMRFSASRWIIRLHAEKERKRELFILISLERACPS